MGFDGRPVIYARKTTVHHVPSNEAREFCNLHHIQGYTTGSYYLALKNNEGETVAISIWKKIGTELRLERYCTKPRVIGGLGKLLKEAKSIAVSKSLESITTFADLSAGYTGTYEKLGFNIKASIKPDYKYIHKEKRVHKFNFRKHRFMTNPDLSFEHGMTEKQLAELNGLLRVWDCGKTKYSLPVITANQKK